MAKTQSEMAAYRARKKAPSPQRYGEDGYGKPSAEGSMKKAIAYHGTNAYFDKFNAGLRDERHNVYGAGIYLTRNKEQALLYGDHVYEVEITYSTDLRTSKKTGRKKDFQYSEETGYWVIPPDSVNNLKITGVSDSGLSVSDFSDGKELKIHRLRR